MLIKLSSRFVLALMPLLCACDVFRGTFGNVDPKKTDGINAKTSLVRTSNSQTEYILCVVIQVTSNVLTSQSWNARIFEVSEVTKKAGQWRNIKKPGNKQFIAVFCDQSGDVIDKISFDDPLKQHLEYIDDDGHLATKENIIDTGLTLLRINYDDEVKWLRIEDISGRILQEINLINYIK